MNKLVLKYNNLLIFGFVFAPFLAFLLGFLLDLSFNRTMQSLTYLGVLLILVLKEKSQRIKFPKYLLFYSLFVVYVFFSTFILLKRDFNTNYLLTNYLIGSFNIMFIIENLTISKTNYNNIVKYSKYVLFIAFCVILYQQAFDPLFFARKEGALADLADMTIEKNRLFSIYSWIGFLALGFGFVPIFLLVIEELEKQGRWVLPWIIVGVIVAFLSKSRWIMINSFLVFVLLLINHRQRSIQLLKYVILLPAILIFSYLFLNLTGFDPEGIVKNRILEKDKSNIRESSAFTRILAFEAFDRLYWDKPIFGAGNIKYGMGGTGEQEYKLRSFLKGRSSQIHVGYLSLFYMYGLVGGIFFLSFLSLLLKKLFSNAKKTARWAPFLAFFGFFLANWTQVAYSVFEMGLVIVLVADKFYSQNLNFNSDTYAQ